MIADISKDIRFVKTSIGEAELRTPVLDLPIATRALLDVVEFTVPIEQCLLRSRARLSDAVVLLTHHLIQATAHPNGDSRDSDDGQAQLLVDALLAMQGDELYSFLTAHSKHQLGLIQGFRLILALERCENDQETRALAIHFVQRSWQLRGAQGIASLSALLVREIARLRAGRH